MTYKGHPVQSYRRFWAIPASNQALLFASSIARWYNNKITLKLWGVALHLIAVGQEEQNGARGIECQDG